MIMRDELRAWVDDPKLSDDDLDAVIVAATPEHLRGQITPETELRALDTEHPVWAVLDAAFDSLQPRIAVILTDRAVLDGGRFDADAILAFIARHRADDPRADVWFVLDSLRRESQALIDFAHSHGFSVAAIGIARSESVSPYTITLDGLLRFSYPRIVILDSEHEPDDPRVTILRELNEWSATDLSRALDRGEERDIADAIAALSVTALSTRAEARGEDWDGSWEDALALGLRLRNVLDEEATR